jgi:ferrous iron transport protein B
MSTAAVAADPRPLKVALVGNPNTGKSTLFNALAGMHARVGNYPGVTVEKKVGRVRWEGRSIDLIDLPGTYSIAPRSPDELVSVDVLLGRQPDIGQVDAVICIADASNLERHLYLASQLLDLGVPLVLVLNIWDAVERHGLTINVEGLRERLGVPIVVTEAHRRKGIDALRAAVLQVVADAPPSAPRLFPPPFYEECGRLEQLLDRLEVADVPYFLRERMLLDAGGTIEERYLRRTDGQVAGFLTEARSRLAAAGYPVATLEAERRYAWARDVLQGVVTAPPQRRTTATDRIDALLTHHVGGLVAFALVMLLVFQTIYFGAEPLMDACEAGQEWVKGLVATAIAPGPLQSLLADGVVAGVGGVLVFLPQIALLFLFIALLEDCGYMARAAYMMDRAMAPLGLSGRSFLPLMSSFACAVPGIMATRVIDSHRERMVTILIAPLMSCSARLPVYILLTAAFVPATSYLGGLLTLQGLVLFAMSSLGLLVAIPTAWALRRTFFRGEASAFVMELPEYKVPSARLVLHRVYDRSMAFVTRAGTLIFATTILVWAAGYFPGDRSELQRIDAELAALESAPDNDITAAERERLQEQRNAASAELIRGSLLGRAGRALEPAVKPLGWDWRIGVGVLASFPAREVIIGTLGTIYSLGGDVDEETPGLREAIKASKWPDGRPVCNVPVALSIMVFFALCAQCASTLMVIRRETNSWRWPAFCFAYMTALAYVGALVTYQVGMAVGIA